MHVSLGQFAQQFRVPFQYQVLDYRSSTELMSGLLYIP
ncbi:hypothetical protein BMETH_797_1 [methanotrophic bacterial endosymbiont of Bathymodiolus sp.]|nr:hypothetical protein BMETH_797_1 [methanotrophic bacterial endosymbiont of Bathymodiolus sp.]